MGVWVACRRVFVIPGASPVYLLASTTRMPYDGNLKLMAYPSCGMGRV